MLTTWRKKSSRYGRSGDYLNQFSVSSQTSTGSRPTTLEEFKMIPLEAKKAEFGSPLRVEFVDGLRGTAALIVLLWHVIAVFSPAAANGVSSISHSSWEVFLFHSPITFFYKGSFAVCLFFVLSGFILTLSFFEAGDSSIIYIRALSRYTRLVIPAGFSSLFAALLINFNLYYIQELSLLNGANQVLDYTNLFKLPVDITHLLKSVLLDVCFGNSEFSELYNLVLWTMPVEFLGSILVFIFSLSAYKSKFSLINIVVIAFFFLIINKRFEIFLLSFLIGATLARFHRSLPRFNSIQVSSLLLVSLYLGGFGESSKSYAYLTVLKPLLLRLNLDINVFMHFLASVIMLYLAITSESIGSFFSKRFFVYFGFISFPLYLIHQPLVNSLSSWIILRWGSTFGYNLVCLVSFLILVAVAIPFAHLMKITIDDFATHWSKTIAKKLLILLKKSYIIRLSRG
ncbi:acyltransferase family protein [Phormidesmis priestleyi]|nr:acyltransferase [Phormidesmis priestleyi]